MGEGGGDNMELKGKESDTPLFLRYLSTSDSRKQRDCWSTAGLKIRQSGGEEN